MARYKTSSELAGSNVQLQSRKRIQKMLSSDREAIRHSRAYTATRDGFGLLDKSEQERRMNEAMKTRIQGRIDAGLYVSCNYSEFIGYLPPSYYGQFGHVKDPEKDKRLDRQLEALRREHAGDDDDEEPVPCKTEEPTKKRKMSEFLDFVDSHETHLSKDSNKPRHQDETHNDKNHKAANTGRRSQGSNSTPHTLRRQRVDKSHQNNDKNKKETTTWRAVSRGQPLPPGTPAADYEQRKPKVNKWQGRAVFRGQPLPPGVPAANFQQMKPKVNRWSGRVVFRGQVMAEDDKDED
jgi:hypothetical protein